MIHRHDWKLVTQDAAAYYRKNNWPPEKAATFIGTIWKCQKCPKTIFEPDDRLYRVVEVSQDAAPQPLPAQNEELIP